MTPGVILSAAPDDAAEKLAALAGPLGWLSAAIDLASVAILVLGALRFAVRVGVAELSGDGPRQRGVDAARVELRRYILAGLELLIVSDVMRTALSFALHDVIFLGALVLVRSLISFFPSREIEGLERGPPARSGDLTPWPC
jgi:uncharacterized membrane protein